MIKYNCISLDSPVAWRETLSGIKHSFGQTWESCYAMHLTTGLKTFLFSCVKDSVRFVCPFAERQYGEYVDIAKPFGFSGFIGNADCEEASLLWTDFVKRQGYVCGYLGLNPIYDYSSHFNSEEIFEYDTVYVIDLTRPLGDIFANMDRNRRRQLKNWEEIKGHLILQKSALEVFFLDQYYDHLRRKNASPFYYLSRKTFSFLFGLDNVIFVGAQQDGKIVAVTVFAYTHDVCDAMFNVSLPEGRQYYAALMWQGVIMLKAMGVSVMNLGGGKDVEYKRRFGCRTFPLRCLKQVYAPDIYKKLCQQVAVDSNDMTGIFPAYRKAEFESPAIDTKGT